MVSAGTAAGILASPRLSTVGCRCVARSIRYGLKYDETGRETMQIVFLEVVDTLSILSQPGKPEKSLSWWVLVNIRLAADSEPNSLKIWP